MSRAVTSMRRREIGLLAVVTIAAVCLATVAVALLESVVGIANASAIYLVAVVVSAVIAGTIGAVITSLASFLLYDYLFVVPYHTLSVEDPEEWLSLVLLLFVGIVVGQLTSMQRSRARAAVAGEHEARALFAVSRSLATRDSMQGGLASVADVLLPQAVMSRVWIALGADEASERIVADTGEGRNARPARACQRSAATTRRRGPPLGTHPSADGTRQTRRRHRLVPGPDRRRGVAAGVALRRARASVGRAQRDRDAPARLGGRPDRAGRRA